MLFSFKSSLFKGVAVCVASILLPSCATIFSGTTQDLNVKVVDSRNNSLLEGVTCKVTDKLRAEYSVVSNPGVVNIRKGYGNLSVTCNKKGYRQLNMAIGNSFDDVTLVNILFPPGFIVDGVTGAWQQYPSHYVVMMEPTK